LLAGRLTAHLKGDWPGARVGQIDQKNPYHLQGANGTDKNVVSCTKTKVGDISYHAAKFEENLINKTAVRRHSIRG
jgi:hypothetical protein